MRPKRNRKISTLPSDECRVCLSVGANVSLFTNFEDTKTATELVKMLMESTAVMISLDDPLPKKLCIACVGRLQDAQRLKELAQSSDKLLRQKYGLLDTESPAYSEKYASLLYTTFDIKQETEADDVCGLEDDDFSPIPMHDSSSDYEPPEVKTKKSKLAINRPADTTKAITKRKKLQKKKSRTPFEDIKQEHLSDYVFIKGYNEKNVCLSTDNEANVRINKSKQLKKWAHEKKYQCPACPEMFSRKKIYTKHLRRDHKLIKKKVYQKKHKCHLCPEAFGLRKKYRQHMRIAHKLRGYGVPAKYMCQHCGKVFKQSALLKNHSGCLQMEDLQLPCNICGKIFKSNSSLNRHVNEVHKKIKPHKCELCPLKFTTSALLRQHKLWHTGEKPHACSHCGRRFLQKSVLLRHLLTHTGRKPCSCKHCDQRFSAAGDVRAHVKRMHKGESIAKVSDYCRYIPEESNDMLAIMHQTTPATSSASIECITKT